MSVSTAASCGVYFTIVFTIRTEFDHATLISSHRSTQSTTHRRTKCCPANFSAIDCRTDYSAGKILEFKVMVRPLKAINAVHGQMGEMLEKLKAASATH